MTHANDEQHWSDHGACNGYANPDAFFPEEGDQGLEGKRVCAGCPVRDECLTDALERHEMHGTWGGASERVRRHLRHFLARCPHEPVRVPGCGCQFCKAWDRHDTAMAALVADGQVARLDDNGPGARHGTAARYARGCRCPDCTDAMRASRARNRGKAS